MHKISAVMWVAAATFVLWAAPRAWGNPSEACPATLPKIVERCGCDPKDEAVFNACKVTGLNSDARVVSKIRECAELKGGLELKGVKIASGAIDGCLAKISDQFPDYRDALVTIAKSSLSVPSDKYSSWLGCYSEALGQPRTPPAKVSAKKRPVPVHTNLVIAMDSLLRPYDGVSEGASNGFSIRDALLTEDAALYVQLEPAYPRWNSYAALWRRRPDAIVIQASAFEAATPKDANGREDPVLHAKNVQEGNDRLSRFVARVNKELPFTRFLIYSRRWSGAPVGDCVPDKVLHDVAGPGWLPLDASHFQVMCLGSAAYPGDFTNPRTLELLQTKLRDLLR
jgi:hypothetical protein